MVKPESDKLREFCKPTPRTHKYGELRIGSRILSNSNAHVSLIKPCSFFGENKIKNASFGPCSTAYHKKEIHHWKGLGFVPLWQKVGEVGLHSEVVHFQHSFVLASFPNWKGPCLQPSLQKALHGLTGSCQLEKAHCPEVALHHYAGGATSWLIHWTSLGEVDTLLSAF